MLSPSLIYGIKHSYTAIGRVYEAVNNLMENPGRLLWFPYPAMCTYRIYQAVRYPF